MPGWVERISVVDGPVFVAPFVATIALILFLLAPGPGVRRSARTHLTIAALGGLIGGIAGAPAVWLGGGGSARGLGGERRGRCVRGVAQLDGPHRGRRGVRRTRDRDRQPLGHAVAAEGGGPPRERTARPVARRRLQRRLRPVPAPRRRAGQDLQRGRRPPRSSAGSGAPRRVDAGHGAAGARDRRPR